MTIFARFFTIVIALLLSCGPVFAQEESQSIRSRIEQAEGKEYYDLVENSSNVVAALAESAGTLDISPCLQLILEARRDRPEIFNDFWKVLSWARELPKRENVECWYRYGYLDGRIEYFLGAGPETRYDYVKAMRDDGAMASLGKQGPFTDEEIQEGKERNRAARLAFLELFLKGLDLLNGREQVEVVELARMLWEKGKRPEYHVPIDRLLSDIIVSDRYSAITRLFLSKSRNDHQRIPEIYRSLLQDSESPYYDFYYSYVKEALEFIKQNHPEELDKLETNLPWKRAAIDVARGLPYKEWRRDDEDQSKADEAIDIEF